MNKKELLNTAKLMIAGSLLTIMVAYTAWIILNWDVQAKCMRFPEAVRSYNVTLGIEERK